MKQPKGRVALRRQNPGAPGLGWRGLKHAGNTLPPEEHKGPREPRKLARGQPEVPEGPGLSGRSARGASLHIPDAQAYSAHLGCREGLPIEVGWW